MHELIRKEAGRQIKSDRHTSLKLFDSVRGVFPEGGEAYPGSSFSAKSHIQICIRNSNCIKRFFVKREEIDFLKQKFPADKIESSTGYFFFLRICLAFITVCGLQSQIAAISSMVIPMIEVGSVIFFCFHT